MRLVSTSTFDVVAADEAAASFSPLPVSPFSFVLDSDLCDLKTIR
jgi:hypothetical protein